MIVSSMPTGVGTSEAPVVVDSAASDGDAGDTRHEATPIEEGSYEGRLTPEVDEADIYTLPVEAGQGIDLFVHGPMVGAERPNIQAYPVEASLGGPGAWQDRVLVAQEEALQLSVPAQADGQAVIRMELSTLGFHGPLLADDRRVGASDASYRFEVQVVDRAPQDDAGSGGDAGDPPVSIDAGTWTGTFDRFDPVDPYELPPEEANVTVDIYDTACLAQQPADACLADHRETRYVGDAVRFGALWFENDALPDAYTFEVTREVVDPTSCKTADDAGTQQDAPGSVENGLEVPGERFLHGCLEDGDDQDAYLFPVSAGESLTIELGRGACQDLATSFTSDVDGHTRGMLDSEERFGSNLLSCTDPGMAFHAGEDGLVGIWVRAHTLDDEPSAYSLIVQRADGDLPDPAIVGFAMGGSSVDVGVAKVENPTADRRVGDPDRLRHGWVVVENLGDAPTPGPISLEVWAEPEDCAFSAFPFQHGIMGIFYGSRCDPERVERDVIDHELAPGERAAVDVTWDTSRSFGEHVLTARLKAGGFQVAPGNDVATTEAFVLVDDAPGFN